MKIYTKTGDEGKTSLFGGKRVWKDDLRIEAYGNVDELNSLLGLAEAEITQTEVKTIIHSLQNRLFDLGSDLASPVHEGKSYSHIPRINKSYSESIEKLIDDLDCKLDPLKNFILPGGTKGAAILHNARTVCRRVERSIIKLDREENIGDEIKVFINRISDFLFVLARYVNKINGIEDIAWQKENVVNQ
ncbi:MAG: cob(I)yrinic acid a,c-diamide adenosyltransferase [Melioribacteraceae bacterium]|nr:cob(I)yrinic acid a,c-diamide adenosyltransferase [Melioribacteraceae bacterium]MCF8266254.1 cob(I)yrinic acid a,c-diamide adenosyltransferase [Melioribacteraceae bacterium]MCF8411958.1 cob(I)yrinic acid a,c-diamide adenosyltransferase [Melioribacteraceae bacterium]